MNADVKDDFLQPSHPIYWKAALSTGLIAGGIFLLFSKGSPWTSGDIAPTVVGRPLPLPPLLAAALHMVLSVGYAMLIVPVVNRLRAAPAIITGGLAGAGLYLVNFALFNSLLARSGSASEALPTLTHVVFGLVVAAVYKGLTRSGPARVQENMP